MTFVELLNEDYGNGTWLEPKYRNALKAMEKTDPPQVKITRAKPLTLTGRPATGLDWPDTVTFV